MVKHIFELVLRQRRALDICIDIDVKHRRSRTLLIRGRAQNSLNMIPRNGPFFGQLARLGILAVLVLE